MDINAFVVHLTNLGPITCENEFSHLILVSGEYFHTFFSTYTWNRENINLPVEMQGS